MARGTFQTDILCGRGGACSAKLRKAERKSPLRSLAKKPKATTWTGLKSNTTIFSAYSCSRLPLTPCWRWPRMRNFGEFPLDRQKALTLRNRARRMRKTLKGIIMGKGTTSNFGNSEIHI